MVVRWWKTTLVTCLALLGEISDARAERWLFFSPISGELSLGVDSRWRSFDGGETLKDIEYEETLLLQFAGYGLDPRIFNFNFTLEPSLEQQRTDTATGTTATDSTLLNYYARFSLLHGAPASPVSLSADFSSNDSEIDGSLGSRSDVTVEARGADLHWKFAPLPVTLSYREQSLDETFFPGLGVAPTEREEFQQTYSLRARNRKMYVLLEGNEFDDRTASDQDYESQKARLENRFHWGKGSSLTSQLEYFNREGFNEQERVLVDENLRLQHTDDLYTTYEYRYDAQNRTVDSDSHRGRFGLNHRLYTNLTTNFTLERTSTKSDQFEEDGYDSRLDFYYRKQLRPDLQISAELGSGYRVSDRIGGQIDITESFTVPLSRIVVLSQRFVIVSTIVVNSANCGGTSCQLNVDYLVQDAGGDFTQLEIPVTSSINVNDVIDVQYVAQPPTAEFYAIPYRVGVRVNYGAFDFYHRTTGENQTFVSGPDPTAVGDYRNDTTGLQWNWSQGRSRASIGAERIYQDNIDRITTEYALRESLSYAIRRNLSLSVALRQSVTEDQTDVTAIEGDASLGWAPFPGLTVTPRISAYNRTSDPGASDDFIEGSVDFRWIWHKLFFDLRYSHMERDSDGSSQVEDRLVGKIRRRF